MFSYFYERTIAILVPNSAQGCFPVGWGGVDCSGGVQSDLVPSCEGVATRLFDALAWSGIQVWLIGKYLQ